MSDAVLIILLYASVVGGAVAVWFNAYGFFKVKQLKSTVHLKYRYAKGLTLSALYLVVMGWALFEVNELYHG